MLFFLIMAIVSYTASCLLYFFSPLEVQERQVNLCLPCFYQLVYLTASVLLLVHGGHTRLRLG